ncbi:hypothetical protein NY11_04490 [Listeria monocytogenes]|nr:hypothetical protein [Listeria monocytogenes]
MTEGRNLTLVDIDSLDKKLLTDFYPKITHKKRAYLGSRRSKPIKINTNSKESVTYYDEN